MFFCLMQKHNFVNIFYTRPPDPSTRVVYSVPDLENFEKKILSPPKKYFKIF